MKPGINISSLAQGQFLMNNRPLIEKALMLSVI